MLWTTGIVLVVVINARRMRTRGNYSTRFVCGWLYLRQIELSLLGFLDQ